MTKTKSAGEIELLLAMLDDAFDKPAWHGPNLRGTLRRLSVAEAMWRPQPKRHCIAEIVVHCAYWKYAARRRLRGDKRGSFPLKGSNWFALPTKLTDDQLKEYVRILDAEHAALRQTVVELPPSQLLVVPQGAKVTNQKLIYGIAAHDVYHAGQIRLLMAMQSKA